MANNEQIRDLHADVHLAGILAELEVRNDRTKDGSEYLSFKGAIQCSPDDTTMTARFSFFAKKYTKSGSVNKLYDSARKWAVNAIPMTKNKEEATLVDMTGNLRKNNYVATDGTFRETISYEIKFFNNFKEYAYEINLEGYIKSITDDVDAEENETGRKKILIVSKDSFNDALVFYKDNIIIAEEDIAKDLDAANYEPGRTVLIRCERAKEVTEAKVKKGGFGKQPVITNGRTTTYWKIVGGECALDEDDKNCLTKAQISELLYVYDEKNKEIMEKGNTSSGSGSKAGFGKKPSSDSSSEAHMLEIDEDDDNGELPF